MEMEYRLLSSYYHVSHYIKIKRDEVDDQIEALNPPLSFVLKATRVLDKLEVVINCNYFNCLSVGDAAFNDRVAFTRGTIRLLVAQVEFHLKQLKAKHWLYIML